MPKTTKSIGGLILQMRKASGMSQMAVAARIGVSYQQIQKYEKGRSKLTVPRLIQFADVFGVPVTAFLEESKTEVREKARFSNLSDDEATMIKLFRRLPGKPYRAAFLKILMDIVRLSHGSPAAGKGGTV